MQLWSCLARESGPWKPAGAAFQIRKKAVVADGPFAGIEAIFRTSDAESRSMILLLMLRKPAAMRIDTACLRKAGQ